MNAGKDIIIEANNITVNRGAITVIRDISFSLSKGDHLAIIGNSGGGKTTLGLAIAGRAWYKGSIEIAEPYGQRISWIEQQHHFKNLSNTSDFYYQQRFNSSDAEDAHTVQQTLAETGGDIAAVLKTMKIEYLADEPLIQLSNGENKKLQLATALLQEPSILIMDQPFIGLDAVSRKDLHQIINHLASQGLVIILITTPDEIPSCITQVLVLENGIQQSLTDVKSFNSNYSNKTKTKQVTFDEQQLKDFLSQQNGDGFEYAIRMNNVTITYGEKKILAGVDWEVKNGERWLLSGPNGAGKSTLLSLVTGDNPQAYANEIYLFDKKRGSGESIWDIKRKIGFLSPELHLFFDQGCSAFEAIASGLFDTIGLFRQLNDEQIQLVDHWMKITGIHQLRQKRLFELSAGQQRIVLLVRALVKNPPLLILDEPCQGLDREKEADLLELINAVCLFGNKTMVFVTHYANDRPDCIKNFIALEKGRVISGSWDTKHGKQL
jgi:molybdate transport system ATP-binding protein